MEWVVKEAALSQRWWMSRTGCHTIDVVHPTSGLWLWNNVKTWLRTSVLLHYLETWS